jgi:hypothetical protein
LGDGDRRARQRFSRGSAPASPGPFDLTTRGSYAEIYLARNLSPQVDEPEMLVVKALNLWLQGEPEAALAFVPHLIARLRAQPASPQTEMSPLVEKITATNINLRAGPSSKAPCVGLRNCAKLHARSIRHGTRCLIAQRVALAQQ